MNLIKKVAIGTAAFSGIVAMGGVAVTQAASVAPGRHPMSNMVAAIAQKFNLKEADVQQVFDEQRSQGPKMHLDQAVKNGKLTQAQADLITAKQAEMKTFMETLKDKTPSDRQAAMNAQKETFIAWAKTNNIPESFLQPFHRGPGKMGMGQGMRRGGGAHGFNQGEHRSK